MLRSPTRWLWLAVMVLVLSVGSALYASEMAYVDELDLGTVEDVLLIEVGLDDIVFETSEDDVALVDATPYTSEMTYVDGVVIATPEVLVNEVALDHLNSTYPLLQYNNIVYFPLTYAYGQVLGFGVDYAPETGLAIYSAPVGENDLGQYALGEDATPYVGGTPVQASTSTMPILLNSDDISTQGEWPCLFFNDIAYLPFTWTYMYDGLGIMYTFQEDPAALIISGPPAPAAPELPPAEIDPMPQPSPFGHPISAAELMEVKAMLDKAQQPEEFSNSYCDIALDMAFVGEEMSLDVEVFMDMEAERVLVSMVIPNIHDEDAEPDLAIVYLRANPDDETLSQLFLSIDGETWEEITDVQFPNFFALTTKSIGSLQSAVALPQEALDMLDKLGLGGLYDPSAMEAALAELLTQVFYKEETVGNDRFISLSYVGSFGSLLDTLNIDLAKIFTAIVEQQMSSIDLEMWEMTEEELQATIDESLETLLPIIAIVKEMNVQATIVFNAATGQPEMLTIGITGVVDESATLIVNLEMEFGYDDEMQISEMYLGMYVAAIDEDDEELPFLALEADYSYEYNLEENLCDWEAIDDAVIASAALDTDQDIAE